MTDEETTSSATHRPYACPELTIHGSLEEMTATEAVSGSQVPATPRLI